MTGTSYAHRARRAAVFAEVLSGPQAIAWIVVVVLGMSGCARPATPVGGDVPETPLGVVQTRPEPLELLAPFDGPVVIEFDRRVSERLTGGSLQDAVIVSPRLGDVDVSAGRGGLEISMEGGFRAQTVYRITVLPWFQDRYQNRMAQAFDLIFSTGDELEPNLLAGLVTDRLTLQEVEGARVDAIPTDDGFPHVTVTDSTGIFTFPYLPARGYTLVAYEDQNRNREPDFQEPQDSLAVNLARGDTLIVTEPRLLAPDTTAAVLQDAAPVDTLALRLTFDDYLDPEASLDAVTARVFRTELEDPEDLEVLEVFHTHEWEARTADALDDPAAPPADPDAAPATPPTPSSQGLLPAREIVLLLSGPLEASAPYKVEVGGVTNINGVSGGGGEAEFDGPPEPEPEVDPDAVDTDTDPSDPNPDDPPAP